MGAQWTATYTQQFTLEWVQLTTLSLSKAIFSKLLHIFLRDPYLHKWGSDTIEPWLAHTSTAR